MSHVEIDRAKSAKVKPLRLSISLNAGRLIHNTYVNLVSTVCQIWGVLLSASLNLLHCFTMHLNIVVTLQRVAVLL